jgi:glycosyl transferase family 87
MSRSIESSTSQQKHSGLSRAISALTHTWILALLWLMVFLYAARFVLYKLPAPPHFTDFNHFYISALAFRSGANPYVTNLSALPPHGLELSVVRIENQPPTLLLCFEPLTRLDPRTAYWIWVGISFASLVAALILLLKETALDRRQALLFGALLFSCPVIYEHFYFANMQITITLLMVVAIVCMARGADRWAGLPLAFAMALKAYPAFLGVYLICDRRWRALSWMAIWSASIGLITLWLVGFVSFSFLDTFSFTTARRFLQDPGFLSINAVVSRLFWHGSAPLNPSMDAMREAAVAAVELAVFAMTVWATANAAPDRNWRAFSLWVTAMILLSPVGEPQYLILLLVPFASVADAAARGEAGGRVIYGAVAGYLLTFSRYPLAVLRHFGLGSAALFWWADQFWFFALALAYVTLYWLVASRQSAQEETSFALTAAPASGPR